MKKVACIIFILVMLFSFPLSVNAEEFNGADLFTVSLPDGFQQTGTNVSDFTFENENGDTFTVTYADNTEKEKVFSPADMSKKDIQKYTDTISQEAETVMKEYVAGFNLEFSDCIREKQKNGKTALVSEILTTIKTKEKESLHYQTMYEFGGVNYKYTFTYTTDDESRKDSFDEVFESINIFEGETKTNSDRLAEYALFGALGLVLLIGIIRFIRTPEKRAQGKL